MSISMEGLRIVHAYLFGGVKFLDLLVVLMFVDIITGVLRAIKEKRLRSRSAMYGYARKIAVFGIIILANIIDVILSLQGTIAFATVLFYIANEAISIVENMAQIGVKVPHILKDKLQVIQEAEQENTKESDAQ
ncbi:phage holin family protein [Ectobacillus antri]|uniref:phage holin family protein n=1 Tax=Ectobacillus antri TaxID=2486280 RepID=UPI000F5A3EF9|nr:phage holin family protein [Ectobacillus antri]